MSIWDEMNNDGEEFLTELGRDIVFRGVQMKAIIDTNQLEQFMNNGGMVLKAAYRIRMFAKKDGPLWNNPPQHSEIIEVYGKEFTIVSTVIRKPSPWFDVTVHATDQ